MSEMSVENQVDSKTRERDQLGWISGFLRRKKRTKTSEEVKNQSEDSRLMRRNKGKNLHLNLSEIMRKLKHAIRKEKPRQDKRLLEKKNSFQKSLSTKDHFFLERMTSISQKRSRKEHTDNEKHLSEMLNIEDFDPNLAKSKQVQSRIVSLPEYSSLFSSPGRIGNPNSTVLSRSASESETVADDSISNKEIETASSTAFISKSNQIDDEISKVEAYDAENEGQILKETPSLLSVASPSHYISYTEEYDESVLQPLFIEYEIAPARGEPKIQPLCNQLKEKNHPMDDKDAVYKYVKAVLDAIDSNWEELYLKTEFSDQLLYPALISNIPFYPNQLCVEHELLFDSINEVVFEFCRFPQWVSFAKPRSQVLSFSGESIIYEFQEKVYCHLLSSRKCQSSDQIVREDMAKPRSWLDIRCELECIGFETSELILNELLEEFMLDLVIA